jgi:PAS domain S-box-containing protein
MPQIQDITGKDRVEDRPQNEEKEKRAAELVIANKELAFQKREKIKRADELIIANKELIYQNEEKEKRAAELIIANKELLFQNEEKEKRAAELVIANKELIYQNEEKEKRASELVIANKELIYQNEEKEKRAAELIIANKELIYQNEEKEKRAAELIIANKELLFQNGEKEKRAAELINANRLYAFLSQINQTIVHSKNEQIVFKEVCRIAHEIGKFRLAWICTVDQEYKKIDLIEECGMLPEDISSFTKINYTIKGAHNYIIETGNHYVNNNIEKDAMMVDWQPFSSKRGWRSGMVLPIKKSGTIVAIFNVISSEKDFFSYKDIALLEEAANDISFALDVFEKDKQRKQIEDKAIHNELRLKQAQAIAHYGNWELDFLTGNGVWSEEACRIYGFSPDDNIQSYQTWLSFIHPEDLEYVMKVTKKEQERESNTAFHHRIIRKDGAVRHIFSQAHFEFDTEGIPVSLYSVVHDITETKEAEEALAQSETNLRQIMDLIPQSIFVKDYQGKFVFVNKSYALLHGLTTQQVTDKSMTEIATIANNADHLLEEDREVISSGVTKTIPECTFIDDKCESHLLHIVKVPFTVAGSNEKAVLGITVDITEQKHAEVERTKMIADIVQRNKNLEQFSYIVSHNLRAPVANILGLTNVIETIGFDNNEEKTIISYMATAAKNLDNVIRDINYILELKHEINEKKQSVKFTTLLDEIKSSIDNVVKESQVKILGDFERVNEMLTVKSYLHSIFYNLISNSIKYRQTNIPPVIEITSIRFTNKIVLIFKDNGLGIDIKKKGKDLFGLYKRFHDHVEGKGMGLFMVKTQVETLGGTIAVSSEVNKGTTFTIEFEVNDQGD